jgi:amino acid transporter
MIMKGWHQLNFTSPLAQLLLLLNLNFWAIVLYLDACVSPSGTAIIYTGSASRNFTGMAEDQQMPQFFNALHPIYNISRRSLLLTLAMCICMVVFFRNWQKIMIVVTVFQLITCVAIPISFVKLRQTETKDTASFRVPFGRVLAIAIYLLTTYLLVQAGTNALVLSLVLHVILFTVYTLSQYKGNTGRVIAAFQSSWTSFCILLLPLCLVI